MAIKHVQTWHCQCGALLRQQVDLIEGLEPKAEPMQSVARQQDAALSPDESGRSAAGNPTDSLEEFVKWAESQLAERKRMNTSRSVDWSKCDEQLRQLKNGVQKYRSRGAA